MTRCRRCRHVFMPRERERYCGCAPVVVLATCSECGDVFSAVRLGRRSGRPRKTCDEMCARRRKLRLKAEELRSELAQAASWWLSLTLDQRDAAMAWVKANPPPPGWGAGRQHWASFNRAAFSCEQRVVSGVR